MLHRVEDLSKARLHYCEVDLYDLLPTSKWLPPLVWWKKKKQRTKLIEFHYITPPSVVGRTNLLLLKLCFVTAITATQLHAWLYSLCPYANSLQFFLPLQLTEMLCITAAKFYIPFRSRGTIKIWDGKYYPLLLSGFRVKVCRSTYGTVMEVLRSLEVKTQLFSKTNCVYRLWLQRPCSNILHTIMWFAKWWTLPLPCLWMTEDAPYIVNRDATDHKTHCSDLIVKLMR